MGYIHAQRALIKRVDVGGILQPAATDVAADDFAEVALIKGKLAFGQRQNARAFPVEAGDGGAEVGQARGNHGAQIAGAVNAELHISSRTWSSDLRSLRPSAKMGKVHGLKFAALFGA